MRKKILVDIYLAFNLGDDMFLDYLANRYPEYDFIPFHPGSNYAAFYSNYRNIGQFQYTVVDKIKARLGFDKLKNFTRLASTFDGLLFLGGGIFREESYWKEVYDYRRQITEAFRLRDKPVWFMGCNFGPYHTSEFKEAYAKLFARVTKIHFRDMSSYRLFSDLQTSAYFPDILWDYQLPAASRQDKILGISLINPGHKEGKGHLTAAYVAAHTALIEKYTAQGFQIRLFSFCGPEGDLEIANVLSGKFTAAKVYSYNGEITSCHQAIGECSHFVAARFHAVIIAVKYGIPVIPVIYSSKTENLLDDLGYRGTKISLENIQQTEHESFAVFPQAAVQDLVINAKNHLRL